MSLNEPEKLKKGCSWLQFGVMMVVLFLLLGMTSFSSIPRFRVMQNKMRAGANARQMTGLLLTYASDHNGQFPDAKLNPEGLTANAAFRELFKEGMIQDETIFSSPYSSFIADKNIGTAPDYKQALEQGENHWMMVAGLTNESPAHTPLLLENAVDASWPPRWHLADSRLSHWLSYLFPPTLPRGRSWLGNTLLIGKLDGSVETVKLVEKDGLLYLHEKILKSEGKEPLPNLKLLDVEVKPTEPK